MPGGANTPLGNRLPSGRIAGDGPGAALKDGPDFITNPVPRILARRVPEDVARQLEAGVDIKLAHPGKQEAFVTAFRDVRHLKTNRGLSRRLTLVDEAGNLVDSPSALIKFKVPRTVGIASPILRKEPGFVGFGRTAGNAREFVIPNKPLSELGAEILEIRFFGKR